MNPFLRQITFYLVIILIVISVLMFFNTEPPPERIRYDQFIHFVNNDQVAFVTMRGQNIEAELTDGRTVESYNPPDAELTALLLEKEIPYDVYPAEGPKWWHTAIPYMLTFLLIIGIVYFLCNKRRVGKPGDELWESRARLQRQPEASYI